VLRSTTSRIAIADVLLNNRCLPAGDQVGYDSAGRRDTRSAVRGIDSRRQNELSEVARATSSRVALRLPGRQLVAVRLGTGGRSTADSLQSPASRPPPRRRRHFLLAQRTAAAARSRPLKCRERGLATGGTYSGGIKGLIPPKNCHALYHKWIGHRVRRVHNRLNT